MKYILLLTLTFLVSSCGKNNSASFPIEESASSPIEVTYLDLVNQHRVELGLNPLKHSPFIEVVATGHSQFMASSLGHFGHTGWRSRCKRLKNELKGNLCGEIVAMGQPNHKEVLKAWLGSPEHRETLENPDFTHTGLGVKEDAQKRLYWTQMFLTLGE